MRYLILTTAHGMLASDQLMSNELVGALQSQGHLVDVVYLKWQGATAGKAQILRGPSAEEVLLVPAVARPHSPSSLKLLLKWSASPIKVTKAFRRYFSGRDYDVVISFTPAILFGLLVTGFSISKPKKILFIWDFFPIHHQEIKLVPSWAKPALLKLENSAMAKFDIIYCNLPSNIDFLKSNYSISKKQFVSWTPLWTRVEPALQANREEIRLKYNLPLNSPIAVFGGQITDGRGVEDILSAARIARKQGSDLLFLFIGSGRQASMVDTHSNLVDGNVRRISQVSRDDYLQIVSACDVGIAATVPGVSSHSFPTKIMDYLRAGIPTVIAIEPGSSLTKMIVEAGVGMSVPFGDIRSMLNALETAVHNPAFRRQVATSARAFLEDVLDVRHVPIKIAADMTDLNRPGKEELPA